MTKYEYSHITARADDSQLIYTVNMLAGEGWETYATTMDIAANIIFIGYFLRRVMKDRAEWWDKLQKLSNEVQHDYDGSGDGAGGDQAYTASLEAFYLNAKRDLGLK